MTTFHLNLNVDNAAFDPDPRPELARILRDVADRVEGGERADDIGWYQTILDVNGNDVGRFALKNADGSPWTPGPTNYYGQPIIAPEYFDGEHVANPMGAGLPPVCSCGWTRHEVNGRWFELSEHIEEMSG